MIKNQIVIIRKVKKINIKRSKNNTLNIKETEIVLDQNKNIKEDTLHLLQVIMIDYL